MKVILVRHGKAEDVAPSGNDAERSLTDSGKRLTKKAARGLRTVVGEPTSMFTSPLVRAQQTAEIVAHQFDDCELAVRKDLENGANTNELLTVMAECDETACVVCVGHEPSLSQLAAKLLGTERPLFELRKAGACCISWESQLVLGSGKLDWLLTAKQLRELGR